MTTVIQFWLCSLPCFHFWTQHESGSSWVTALTPIDSSTSLHPVPGEGACGGRPVSQRKHSTTDSIAGGQHLRTNFLLTDLHPFLSLSQTPCLLSFSSRSLSICQLISPFLLFIRLSQFASFIFHSGGPCSTELVFFVIIVFWFSPQLSSIHLPNLVLFTFSVLFSSLSLFSVPFLAFVNLLLSFKCLFHLSKSPCSFLLFCLQTYFFC